MKRRCEQLQSDENALGFDPAHNESDFMQLVNDLGFERIEDIGRP